MNLYQESQNRNQMAFEFMTKHGKYTIENRAFDITENEFQALLRKLAEEQPESGNP